MVMLPVYPLHPCLYNPAQRSVACSPTDDQAEVLIKGPVPLADIIGIAVPSEAAAKEHDARLALLEVSEASPPLVVAPTMFDKYRLRACISTGSRPEERVWDPNS